MSSASPTYAGLDTPVELDIPAGDLGRTLIAISRQGGITISFPPEIVAGRKASAVKGRVVVRDALMRVLGGTGLRLVPGSGGGVTVVADRGTGVSPQGLGDIAAIDVTDESAGSRFSDVGFQAGDAGTSSRLSGTPTKELANTITTVTQKVIQSQVVTSAAEAAQNVSGVTLGASGDGRANFVIRGFQTQGVMVDGIGSFNRSMTLYGQPPIDNVERIEVLKGPSAILTGATVEGGGVNVTTKRPTESVIRDATVRYGSYGYKTLAFDFGGPVADAQGLTYRFVTSGNSADSNYAGYQDPHEYLIAPSVRWTDGKTNLLAGLSYTDQIRKPSQNTFIPVFGADPSHPILRLPRGIPNINPNLGYSTNLLQLFSEQSHDFGDVLGANIVLNNRLRYDTSSDALNSGTWIGRRGQNGTYSSTQTSADYRFSRLFEQVDLTSTYDAGFARQTLKFGLDYSTTQIAYSQTGAPSSQILFTNPSLGLPIAPLFVPSVIPPSSIGAFNSTSLGYYVIDKIDTLDNRLHITGSVRYDDFLFSSTTGQQAKLPVKSAGMTWSSGAVFDITPYFSAYGNINTGLTPSNQIDKDTGIVSPPEQRHQWEAGGRAYLFDKKLSLTAGYFDLAATNVTICDPSGCNPVTSILVPGQKSRGVEFDLQGEIYPGLNIIASFASTVVKFVSPQYTSPFAGIPQYTGSLWTTYTWQDGLLRGLTIGAGGHGNSDSTVFDTSNKIYPVPGFITADAFIGYDIDQWSLSFKVNNLLNKYYYNPSYDSRFIGIGQGRNFLFAAKTSF
ncbi:TonB-dependent receptor [Methylobacterium sp. Leaf117]|uniref:TonB-dependent siderophore receptor n=1 Tax=Methylobacterium sp. Leaf117 TaxID=1736260 RepID=UPI00138F37DC|nr:TonB-dependent receptor [Methylobacterium sp. Leaf117]